MIERPYYSSVNQLIHFFHEHIPEEIKGDPYIFLNPIIDEKKRSQRFFAETARELCRNGIPVVRFDYYGCDDSCGELYEFDLNNILPLLSEIVKITIAKFQCSKVNLLGLRLGADLALQFTEIHSQFVGKICLIEPIIKGSRYLLDQRIRRSMFFKINNINNPQEVVQINGEEYEDFQGYPFSHSNLKFLNDLDSTKLTSLSSQKILLVKLNNISSRKHMTAFNEILSENNTVSFYRYPIDDFWSVLEPQDTIELSKKITHILVDELRN